MKVVSRRKVISALATGGAGLAVAGFSATNAAIAQTTGPIPKAFQGQHTPKPLPFDPAKLKGLSEKLIRSHWENNYGGAVKALNTIEQRLAAMLPDKDLPAYVYGDLKREELVRTGSVVLHENYFANLGGDGKASGKAGAAPAGLCFATTCTRVKRTTTGPGTTCITQRWAIHSSCSICTNTRITWIMVRLLRNTSMHSCKT
jgi:superoxide dismutase, Fe-Mn family